MAPPKKTLYDILGVSQDANAIDIGLAYEKRQARLQGGAAPADPSALALLHEAYEVLGDDARRAAYDASMLTARERAAAAEQAEPDLVLEGGEEEPARKRKPAWIALAAGALVVVALMLVFLRSPSPPGPPPASIAAPAPPPAPPKPKSAAEILAAATTSGGPLLAYEMSGRTTPIGFAMAIEPGTMVTTCHGIPAGNKLVVRAGTEPYPAELVVADEKLDLCKLAVAGFGGRPLALAAEEPKAGDKAYVVVPGKSGGPALAETTVKGMRTAPQGKVLELAMAVPAAGDGGGVFDAQGRLVGIASSRAQPSPNAGAAIPVSAFSEMRSREGAAR